MERKNQYFFNNNLINNSLNQFITKPNNELNEQINQTNPKFENQLNEEENLNNQITNFSNFSNNNLPNKQTEINEENEETITITQKNYDELINTIRKQSLENDQQRSYIEVLKEVLESNLIKNGLSILIPSQQLNTTFNSFENGKFSPQNLKYIIDLSKLSTEIQKYKEELNKEKSINEELNFQLNNIDKKKQDLENENKIIKDKLNAIKNKSENGLFENEKEKENIMQNYILIKEENNKLKDNLNEVQALCHKYENDISEYEKGVVELKKQLDNYKNIEKEYNEIKDSNIKIEYDFERLMREKKYLEERFKKIKDNNEILKAEKSALNKQLTEKDIEIQKEKKQFYIEKGQLITKLTKSKEQNSELKDRIHDKDIELIEFQQRQIENEKLNLGLESHNNELKINYDDYKNDTDFKIEVMNKKNEDLIKQLNKIDDLYRKAEKENSNLLNNINSFKKKVKENENLIDELKTENEGLKSFIKQSNLNSEKQNQEILNINDTLIKLKNENNSLKKELPFWKEKYDKDIKLKTKEEERLKKSLNDMNIKYSNLISNNNKMLNSNNNLLSKNNELQYDLKNLYKNFAKVKDDNIILSDELNDKLQIIQIGNESKKKLCNKAYEQLNQIKELEEKIGNIITEKNNIENQLGEQNYEYKKLKDNQDINNRQMESLSTILNSYNSLIDECSNIIISFIDQIRKIAFFDNNKKIYYSEHYNNFINSCDILSSQINISKLDKLKIIKNYLTESSVENFEWYKQICDLEEANRLLDDKNISLKNQIFNYEDTINKANEYIENKENKFHHFLDNNYKFRENHHNLVMKFNKQNEKINDITNELNNLQVQNDNLNNIVHQLNRENIFIDNELCKTSNNLNILEKKYDKLNKEKNSFNYNKENNNENYLNSNDDYNNNDNMNFQYLTSISNNNKMSDSNNFSNFVESESNRYKNSHYKNWTNETQRYSTSPNSDNFNIQVNTYENDE